MGGTSEATSASGYKDAFQTPTVETTRPQRVIHSENHISSKADSSGLCYTLQDTRYVSTNLLHDIQKHTGLSRRVH